MPTEVLCSPWAGNPGWWEWGGFLPDAPGTCLSCGAETKARTLSCSFRVLPILSFIPTFCLISEAWKAGKRSGPPTLPVNTTTLLRIQPLPAAQPPPPHASSFRQRNPSPQRHIRAELIPEEGVSPPPDQISQPRQSHVSPEESVFPPFLPLPSIQGSDFW